MKVFEKLPIHFYSLTDIFKVRSTQARPLIEPRSRWEQSQFFYFFYLNFQHIQKVET